jgi:hypothetical protein
MSVIGFTAVASAAVTVMAHFEATSLLIFATGAGLRRKRTQYFADKSLVMYSWPARPTRFSPDPLV